MGESLHQGGKWHIIQHFNMHDGVIRTYARRCAEEALAIEVAFCLIKMRFKLAKGMSRSSMIWCSWLEFILEKYCCSLTVDIALLPVYLRYIWERDPLYSRRSWRHELHTK